ncbi:hypothetical protein EDF57_109103 [Novosphingobium sp. PhB55]|nr:hypothetical protein EDF57_109103 [Novosphingobium sp. PhB55]
MFLGAAKKIHFFPSTPGIQRAQIVNGRADQHILIAEYLRGGTDEAGHRDAINVQKQDVLASGGSCGGVPSRGEREAGTSQSNDPHGKICAPDTHGRLARHVHHDKLFRRNQASAQALYELRQVPGSIFDEGQYA